MSPRVLTLRETVGVSTSLRVNDTTHELSLDSRANAVYHATGTRIRSLPISIGKMLGQPAPLGR